MATERTFSREALAADYRRIRGATLALCETLTTEDYVVQSMPDASPTKWHLAHTTWFFETFVLTVAQPSYAVFHPEFAVLYNSYYQAVGPQFPRARRGMLSRPTVREVREYRAHVDGAVERLFREASEAAFHEVAARVELGLHHEEQHQELIVTDLKHMLAQNPLDPVFRPRPREATRSATPAAAGQRSQGVRPGQEEAFGPRIEAGVIETGTHGEGFFFDNEGPRHRSWVEAYRLGRRLVTAGEYLEFIEDGGYSRPDLWLSDGFAAVRAEGWQAPLYWRRDDGGWSMFTLSGRRPVDPEEPVCHVSYYEADAFARWAGARLPREEEWEHVAERAPTTGNFVEQGLFHPAPANGHPAPAGGQRPAASPPARDSHPHEQLFGDVWEWTASAYLGYPGFEPLPGAIGEYNGKFMSGQMVLRGGSVATPARHIRATYRNFFPPSARWQFSGIRLAR
ncbi:MAG: ergothioneine biosynthesis protein EgtB [Polyangiaceae bacterium]